MDDLHEFIERTKKAADLGNLPWWTPTQKTPAIIGRVIEYHQINTEYGMMPGAAVELLQPAVVQDSAKDRPRLGEPGRSGHDLAEEHGAPEHVGRAGIWGRTASSWRDRWCEAHR